MEMSGVNGRGDVRAIVKQSREWGGKGFAALGNMRVAACACAAMLSACAAPSSYMGIDISSPIRPEAPSASKGEGAPTSGQSEIQSLARRAQAGDKQAQLELGIRFEEVRGVERDVNKARKLYAKAAASSGGTIWVYSPPVGNSTSGRVIPVNTGPKQSGLAEAKRRLGRLE